MARLLAAKMPTTDSFVQSAPQSAAEGEALFMKIENLALADNH